MEAIPPLLRNYQEARWLIEAKGWALTKAAEHLAAMPELAGFQLSQTTFTRKTRRGDEVPIEPKLAAAIEGLKTWPGSERSVELVIKGLRALHADPPIVDVERLAQELREHLPTSELVSRLEALEDRIGMRAEQLAWAAERLGRFSWKHAFSGGVGAFAGCLVLVPLLVVGFSALSAGTHGRTIPPGGPDTSPMWFEPEALLPKSKLRLSEWGEKKPLDQTVPFRTLPGQEVAPCNAEAGEVAINGNCWAGLSDLKPPCGRFAFRHGDKCYRPISADPSPFGPGPDR